MVADTAWNTEESGTRKIPYMQLAYQTVLGSKISEHVNLSQYTTGPIALKHSLIHMWWPENWF